MIGLLIFETHKQAILKTTEKIDGVFQLTALVNNSVQLDKHFYDLGRWVGRHLPVGAADLDVNL